MARPIVEFSELKARLDARLKHLGITIKASARWEEGGIGLVGLQGCAWDVCWSAGMVLWLSIFGRDCGHG